MNAPVEAPATFRVRCWNCCRLFDVPADAPLVEQSRWVAHKRGHLFVNECCGGCGSGLFLPKDGSLCESDGPHDQPSDADMYFLAGAFVEDGMATLADRESRLSALARGWYAFPGSERAQRGFALLAIVLSVQHVAGRSEPPDYLPDELLPAGVSFSAAFRTVESFAGVEIGAVLRGETGPPVRACENLELAVLETIVEMAPAWREKGHRFYGALEVLCARPYPVSAEPRPEVPS